MWIFLDVCGWLSQGRAVKLLALSFLAGLVAACGFQPIGLWPLTPAAFALLLWLVRTAPRLRSALARGWWFGVGHFALGLNWIATAFTYQAEMPASLGYLAVVLLSLYLAVYPAAAAGLAWRWGRKNDLRLVFVFAAAWIVTEWLRATLFTGFAWGPIGVVLISTPLSYSARLIGTYGLSGVAALIAGIGLLLCFRRWRSAGAAAAGVVALALAGFLAGGAAPGPAGIALRIVQPNIGQQDKWRDGFQEENMARLERLSASAGGEPRLLLWPEAAVTRPLENDLHDPGHVVEMLELRRDVAAMLGEKDLLLTGGVTWRSADGRQVTSATNSVFAIDPSGRILARYDKANICRCGRSSRRSDCRGSLRATSTSIRAPERGRLTCRSSARWASSSATRSSSRARSSTGRTARPSCSTRPTMPGSAPGGRPSTSPRPGFERWRRGCRCSARPRPGSRP
jgi:apolipoprotein N-acyltransferase